MNNKKEERAKKTVLSTQKLNTEQNKIYKKLLPIFRKEYFIHREAPFGDHPRERCDFKIFHSEGVFYVDTFYAENYQNMVGCINSKIKKFPKEIIWGKIILVNINQKLDSSLTTLLEQRKNPLPDNISLMSEKDFFDYCSTLKSRV